MKETGIVNREICDVSPMMGHTDERIVCNAGFAVPPRCGKALHPLQDKFSHNAAHQSLTRLWHAPKWCALTRPGGAWVIPWNPRHSTCMKNNPNWNDPHPPDSVAFWAADHAATKAATKAFLKPFLKYPCVCARCTYGLQMVTYCTSQKVKSQATSFSSL